MSDDQQQPTPDEIAAALAAAPQQQQIVPMEEIHRSFRNIEMITDDQGNRGLKLLCGAPLKILVLWFPMQAAREIGTGLAAPGLQLPGQNGGSPHV